MKPLKRVVATRAIYLSGAPRLSTRATTESLGPRSHILGVMNGFREHSIELDEFIVGDTTPAKIHEPGSELRMGSSIVRIMAADIGRVFYRLRSRSRLKRALFGKEYDFAYERYALFQNLGSVARRRTGAFWILEVNALLAIEATSERRATTSRSLATVSERKTLRDADLIVAVTFELSRQIQEQYGISTSKIVTIENGVDATLYRSGVIPPNNQVPTIGFLGGLYSWQNLGHLIKSLADKDLESVRLKIAGSGPELANLEAIVSSIGLNQRVEFVGRVPPDEVPHFLSTVDLCYAGHASENGVYFSPLKLWEYLAAGKPIIASSHKTSEQLSSLGYPVRTFNASEKSLVNVLSSSLNELEELTTQGRLAQEKVWREFSWAARITPLVKLIDERQ